MRKQRRKRAKKGEQQQITKAVTHIPLMETNPGKLAILDRLAHVFLALTQQYVTLFCTEKMPDAFSAPCFVSELSERWHRVAIQQAAGIAKSWRTNREAAHQSYGDELAEYCEQKADGTLPEEAQEPKWREWNVPTLREICIQANANVVKLQPSEDSSFDYWLQISTLEFRKQLFVPVKLAEYHLKALTDPETGQRRPINSSVTLNKRNGSWWLTLSYDEVVAVTTPPDAPVIGIDVGIANFITTSDGKQYGTFHAKLRQRQKRDREKRRRKAKLRACLQKKGVPNDKLPSTTSRAGQRLARQVKQSINRAVNLCYEEHEGYQFAYEQLSVASMRFKARAQNAYLRASQLGQIPAQIAWNAKKRGMSATRVKSAYSSQECSRCHYVDRANRPNQQTFCCVVCSFSCHADKNASINIASRLHDEELQACKNRAEVKALLLRRHEQWKQKNSLVVVQAPIQLDLWACSEISTDVG
ncbi:MAG TPA: transposase [Ktedonobacteraceae bacterium]|nr:transposase [Ktedonobacteraceae bacterium]